MELFTLAKQPQETHRLGGGDRDCQTDRETVMRWMTSKYPWKVPGIPDNWIDEYLEKWELIR